MHEKLKEIEKYWKTDAISQSFLKNVLTNDTSKKSESLSMMTGSLIDCIITTPYLVESLFYISELEKHPTPQVKEVLDTYYKKLIEEEKPIEWDDAEVLKIFRSISSSKTGDSKVLEMLADHYWLELEKAGKRKIISKEFWEKCNHVAMIILTHPVTSGYFTKSKEKEILFQHPIYWTYKEAKEHLFGCKGLVDMLIIDHNKKTLQIVDIKTTSDSLSSWKYNIARKFRYDFQLSFYNYGLKEMAEKMGYDILNPSIIVENIEFPGKPRVYNFTDYDLLIGMEGCKRTSKELFYINGQAMTKEVNTIYGWKNAIDIYDKSLDLKLNDYDVDYHENEGSYDFNLWT